MSWASHWLMWWAIVQNTIKLQVLLVRLMSHPRVICWLSNLEHFGHLLAQMYWASTGRFSIAYWIFMQNCPCSLKLMQYNATFLLFFQHNVMVKLGAKWNGIKWFFARQSKSYSGAQLSSFAMGMWNFSDLKCQSQKFSSFPKLQEVAKFKSCSTKFSIVWSHKSCWTNKSNIFCKSSIQKCLETKFVIFNEFTTVDVCFNFGPTMQFNAWPKHCIEAWHFLWPPFTVPHCSWLFANIQLAQSCCTGYWTWLSDSIHIVLTLHANC